MSDFNAAALQDGANAIANTVVGLWVAITTSNSPPTIGSALTNEATGSGYLPGSGTLTAYSRQQIASVTAGTGGLETLPNLVWPVPAGTYYIPVIMSAATAGTVVSFPSASTRWLNGSAGVTINPAGSVNIPAGTITVA